MIRLLYLFLAVLISGAAIAQTGEIQGKVVDENGDGIPFVNVAIFNGGVLVLWRMLVR